MALASVDTVLMTSANSAAICGVSEVVPSHAPAAASLLPSTCAASTAAVAANVRSYTDNTVFRKTTYFYRVRAANSGGKSSYSNVVSVKTK